MEEIYKFELRETVVVDMPYWVKPAEYIYVEFTVDRKRKYRCIDDPWETRDTEAEDQI